jgi:hypothetical protein
MEFRVAHAGRITGKFLEDGVRAALKEAKVKEPDCVVCYGYGYVGPKPSLNAKCSSFTKLEQGRRMSEVLKQEALMILTPNQALAAVKRGMTLIARKVKHAKGKDMLVCKTTASVERAVARDRQYFTVLVDSDTEYRVWIYRKRVLAVYEKRLTEPQNNVKFGRNRANGFTFHNVPLKETPEAVRRVAVAAVRACDLDFGAVDILAKYTNKAKREATACVLEVNSAPGVSDEHRSAIVRLINRVVRWCANDCPGRTEA